MATQILIKGNWIPDHIKEMHKQLSKSELGKFIRECAKSLNGEQAAELIERLTRATILESSLRLVKFKYDDNYNIVLPENYGVVSRKVITTAGVGFLVDAWQNLLEMEIMKYHGIGTNNTAESSGDTALGAESTTNLNPDSTRATGSLTEGASANIFRSVGTLTADGTIAAVEHGLFSQAATGGGTLWDRSVFSTVTLASADSIQMTYDMTASAGG